MSFRTMCKTYLLIPATLVAVSLYVGAVLCVLYISVCVILSHSFQFVSHINATKSSKRHKEEYIRVELAEGQFSSAQPTENHSS